jgi:hypothetical protein
MVSFPVKASLEALFVTTKGEFWGLCYEDKSYGYISVDLQKICAMPIVFPYP